MAYIWEYPPGKSPYSYQVFKKNTLTHIEKNSFQFCSSNYLQSTHGTAMGTKIAVSFANALERGYLAAIVRKYLSEVKFAKRKTTSQ